MTVTVIELAASDSLLRDVAGPVLAALVVSLLGIAAYYIQRGCESRRRRYVDDGVQQLANQFEYTLGVFRHNWARAVLILGHIKNMEDLASPDVCSENFLILQPEHFRVGTHRRVSRLIGNRMFWDVQQKLIPFVQHIADWCAWDLCSAVRLFCDSPGENREALSAKMYEMYQPKLEEFEKRSHKYYPFTSALEDLLAILDEQRFTRWSIARFHRRKDVRKIVAEAGRLLESWVDEAPPVQGGSDKAQRNGPTPN